MSRSNVWTFLIAVVIVFGLWLVLKEFKDWSNSAKIRTEVVTIIDTIRIYDTIYFAAKPRLIVKKDTVYQKIFEQIKSEKDTIFEACVDTNLNGFELKACYQFPINQFLFSGRYRKDTVVVREQIERLVYRNQFWADRWYEYVGVFLVGGLIGMAIR